MDADTPDPTAEAIDALVSRWAGAKGTERANYQLFLTELCALLNLPQPEPARADFEADAYCFERRVIFQHGDGTQSQGFIDLYRRACYVLECKQTRCALPARARTWGCRGPCLVASQGEHLAAGGVDRDSPVRRGAGSGGERRGVHAHVHRLGQGVVG